MHKSKGKGAKEKGDQWKIQEVGLIKGVTRWQKMKLGVKVKMLLQKISVAILERYAKNKKNMQKLK